MGRKKGSIWSYHLKGHHKLAKKQGFVDLTESPVETIGLVSLLIICQCSILYLFHYLLV